MVSTLVSIRFGLTSMVLTSPRHSANSFAFLRLCIGPGPRRQRPRCDSHIPCSVLRWLGVQQNEVSFHFSSHSFFFLFLAAVCLELCKLCPHSVSLSCLVEQTSHDHPARRGCCRLPSHPGSFQRSCIHEVLCLSSPVESFVSLCSDVSSSVQLFGLIWAWHKGYTRKAELHPDISANLLAGIARFKATFGILFENYREGAFFYGQSLSC